MRFLNFSFFILVFTLSGCKSSEKNDLSVASMVIKNGAIYTANDEQPTAQFVAVKDDRIIYVGDSEGEFSTDENTKVIDLEGKTLTPGLIEGHGHFSGVGYNEMNLDLMDVKNYDELIEKVEAAVANAEPGEWIVGRGWHQSKWVPQPEVQVNGFQTHDKLSEVSPNNPVFLSHASGHAAFANAKAMEIAGIGAVNNRELNMPQEAEGGEVIKDELGNPTGIFNEKAMGLISRFIPENDREKDKQALLLAQEACLRNGITGFHDAGSSGYMIDLMQELKDEGNLDIRLYVMLTGRDPDLLEEWFERGPMIDTVAHWLDVRSMKLNCDGALGSRGAWLLEPYTDRPGHYGHETLPMETVEEVSKKALQYGFQVCAHAIGDRANQEVLDRFEIAFNTYPELAEDHRFRIEHAQHLHPDDIDRFAELNVIPAMQAVHLSSDRPWAIDRLGEKRIKEGAYVWQKLLQQGVKIVNGTDSPVEPLNPLPSFYASVSRKTLEGTPEGGFEPDQKMTRDQALKSYTIYAAYGSFMEEDKGSVEVGKLADFTIYDKDIMTIPEDDILTTKVVMTIVGGEVKFEENL